MAEWKAQLTVPVPQEFLKAVEAAAATERRTRGQMTWLLLEWAFRQMRTAGSLIALLRYELGKKKDAPKEKD
jgi:hypothetical protein